MKTKSRVVRCQEEGGGAVMEVINLLSTPVLETCNSLFKTGPDQSKGGNKTPVNRLR